MAQLHPSTTHAFLIGWAVYQIVPHTFQGPSSFSDEEHQLITSLSAYLVLLYFHEAGLNGAMI